MIQAKHCDLCKFPNRDLKIGLTCSLTNTKPIFKSKCTDFEFDNSIKQDFTDLLDEIENILDSKTYVYLNFILLSTLGLLIILGAYFELRDSSVVEFSYLGYKYFSISYSFYFLGTTAISLAFWKLSKYKRTLKALKAEKRYYNNTLKAYNLSIDQLLKNEKRS
ncbi:hypothetical protein [uncultured Winogradskyella sp.]|uniref:hypothetical protein n=1 Tax=Winogradskyella sp. 4-2091 TaxID=3381659 RepID=UPI00260C752A|nr:hypothetical protein [uncultured Winogradskyella sp.]